MSILTKICVIVLIVLVLLACPIFITQATVGPNYRDLYIKEQLARKMAEQTGNTEWLRSESLVKRSAELTQKLEEAQRAAKADQLAGETKIRELLRENAEQKANNALQLADLKRLATVVENDQKRISELVTDVTAMRNAINELNKGLVDQKSQIDEISAERDRQTLVTKSLREQMNQLVTENKDLRDQLAAVGQKPRGTQQAAPATAGPAVELSGRLDTIGENNVASINIGSAKGVKPGMKLLIHRGGEMVGYLRVDQVDVGESVGIIVDKRLEPRKGDAVSSLQ